MPDLATRGAALLAGRRTLAGGDTPGLDARALLKAAAGLDDAALFAAPEAPLAPAEAARYSAYLERRRRGEPVAAIVGRREFWGLTIEVSDRALAPRPETETLVEAVLARRPARAAALSILDLGTGTGCVLCALLTEYPHATGLGVDVSPAFLRLARRNAARLGLAARAGFAAGDWSAAIGGRFDVLVANPPYVAEALRGRLGSFEAYEDPRALFSGADGLDAFRAILADAARVLAPGGLVAVEIGADRAEAVLALAAARFPEAQPTIVPDLAGRPRILCVEPPDGNLLHRDRERA